MIDKLYKTRESLKLRERLNEEKLNNDIKRRHMALTLAEQETQRARKQYNRQLLDENARLQEYRDQLKKQRKKQDIIEEKEKNLEFQKHWKQNPI